MTIRKQTRSSVDMKGATTLHRSLEVSLTCPAVYYSRVIGYHIFPVTSLLCLDINCGSDSPPLPPWQIWVSSLSLRGRGWDQVKTRKLLSTDWVASVPSGLQLVSATTQVLSFSHLPVVPPPLLAPVLKLAIN